MQRVAVLLLIPALLAGGCRTFGSKSKDFKINGDRAAAHALIVRTVLKHYPSVADSRSVVDQFATGLQDGNTIQALSSDKALELAYQKMSSNNPSEVHEFDNYVVEEFPALTNYVTFATRPGTKLEYIGKTKQ